MWSFSFLKAGDFLGQVRCPDSILFQILACLKTNTREEKPEQRDEWDVYGTTVIITHNVSITPLTVPSSNYNNRGN